MGCENVLSDVGGSLLGDGGTPERTLDVGDGGRVGASSAWVGAGVTLEVDVEGSAQINVVAVRSALGWVVRVENVVRQVGVLLRGTVQVLELLDVWEWVVRVWLMSC